MKIKHFLLIALLVLSARGGAAVRVSLVFVGDTGHPAYPGVTQGLAEANLQGRFLGQEYTLINATTASLQNQGTDALAVIAAVGAVELGVLSRALPGIPIYNVTAQDDGLRLDCVDNLLHVIPSDQMLRDAVAQWNAASPRSAAKASAWHPDFAKFAARELNNRFRKAQAAPMDDFAWAGWAAVKMIADSVAREGITTQAKLLHYMRTGLSFDGQKGAGLNFRDSGQLRQLLLLSDAQGKLLGEAPVRGAPGGLDSLGMVDCPK